MGDASEAIDRPAESGVQPHALAGRPRDPSLDHRILEVVRALLAERGYQALSVQEVMRRSSVHVRTITRRWPTKPELVAAAILYDEDVPIDTTESELPSGNLQEDLEQLIRGTLQYLADPAVRAAMPGLWAEMYTDAGLRALFDVRRAQLTAEVRSILESAVTSGSAPDQIVDHAEVVATLLAGAAFSVQSTSVDVFDDEAVGKLVALVTAGILALDPPAPHKPLSPNAASHDRTSTLGSKI